LASNSTTTAKVGVGLDVTNAFSGFIQGAKNGNAGFIHAPLTGRYAGYPSVGYHYFSWNEKGADVNCNFIGDNGGDGQQTGLFVTFWA